MILSNFMQIVSNDGRSSSSKCQQAIIMSLYLKNTFQFYET
jgi:hypothetical protein